MVGDGVTPEAQAWRERAEQLQAALDSRVVLEQAKGMLRERIGLPIESAFQLLRSGARGSGQKIHGLAAEVVLCSQQIVERAVETGWRQAPVVRGRE